jgi:hypothetical protein
MVSHDCSILDTPCSKLNTLGWNSAFKAVAVAMGRGGSRPTSRSCRSYYARCEARGRGRFGAAERLLAMREAVIQINIQKQNIVLLSVFASVGEGVDELR